MSSATSRNNPELACWSTDDDYTDDDYSSSDDDEDPNGGSRSELAEEDEPDDNGAGNEVFGSNAISEFEAALISQLEQNDDDEDDDDHISPDKEREVTVELVGFSRRDVEEEDDDEDMVDVMATMFPLHNSASTTVASSPMASTLVASTSASSSTTEPKNPMVEPIAGGKRRRSLNEGDSEDGNPASKVLRLSTLTREKPDEDIVNMPVETDLSRRANSTPPQASATRVPTFEGVVEKTESHSIPVIDDSANVTTNALVPWPGLPRPKHYVKLKSHRDTVQASSAPVTGHQAPAGYYPSFSIQNHTQTGATPDLSASTSTPLYLSLPQEAPFPNPHPNQVIRQPVFPHVFMPQDFPATGYNINPMPLSNGFGANVNTQGPPAISIVPHTAPQTSYIPSPSHGRTGPNLYPQLQHSYASSSSSTATTTANLPTPEFVMGPSLLNYTRVPQKNSICEWNLGGGQLCNQIVVGDNQARRHISNHILIQKGNKSWNEWEKTPIRCQWLHCRGTVNVGSLNKHVMRQHFCMLGVWCNRCGHEYKSYDTFNVHLSKDQCRG